MTADASPARIAPATAASDRVPPNDTEAERSVLGAMMLSADAANVARESLTRDDFYRPAHASIWDAATELFMRGEPIDPITLSDQLTKAGLLDQVGGRAYVHGLVDTVPTAANVGHYADIVARTSVMRQLIRASQEIGSLGFTPTDEVEKALGVATEVLYDVVRKRIKGDFAHIKDLVDEAYGDLESASEKKEHLLGVPTDFYDLDAILGGLKKGELVVLAARPSIGKTTLALNIAANVARRGMPVAVFSLEMSGEQLAQRMLCAEARVDSRLARTGRLDEAGWAKLADAAGKLSHMTIQVDSTPRLGIVELSTKARKLASAHGLGLIIIDYLQLMEPTMRRTDNRQQEIADISRGLKLMAKEMEVPILALSQLNREIEKRGNKRPQLSDLRESGAIEQDSDVVMFIHRDIYASDEDEDGQRVTELIVAKNRNGPQGQLTLTFRTDYTRFENWAEEPYGR